MSKPGQIYRTSLSRPRHPVCGTPSQNIGKRKDGVRKYRCPKCKVCWRPDEPAKFGVDREHFDRRLQILTIICHHGWGDFSWSLMVTLVRLGWGMTPGHKLSALHAFARSHSMIIKKITT